jgi:glycine hydroxymethyltransferase
MVTSGIRLGTPAATSRGFGITEFKKVGELIVELLDGLAKNGDEKNGAVETKIREDVAGLTQRFPIY